MGLFFNKENHPYVFQNRNKINEPNQELIKINHMSKMVEDQKKTNDLLTNSIDHLKHLYETQTNTQKSYWHEVGEALQKITERNGKHDQLVKEWFANIEKNNGNLHSILERESVQSKEMVGQISLLNELNKEVAHKMETNGTTNEQLLVQMNVLYDMHKQMLDAISKQDEGQQEVVNKLEYQQALMEKNVLQIDHIRSTIYERASFLADKIENGYNQVSSFFNKLITGSNQFRVKQGEKKEKKSS